MECQEVSFTHKVSSLSSSVKDNTLHFHCPVSSCVYAEGSERYFTTKRQLSQHNIKVHAEKKFTCSKCQKGFGLEWHRKHHETTCGQEWKCSCGQLYSCRESLLTHARRAQHHLPSHIRHPQKRQSSKNIQIQQVVVPLVLIVQSFPQQVPVPSSGRKQRVILPKTPTPISLPLQSVPALPGSNGLKKCSVAVQTDHSNEGTSSHCENGADLQNLQLYNYIYSKPHFPQSAEMGGRAKRPAAETQTSNDDIVCQAQLFASRESRASQCSGRVKGKKQIVRIESTETQTTESALVKKRSRSRKKSVAVSAQFDFSTPADLNGHSLWSSLENMLFEDSSSPRTSAATQTSPWSNCVKDLCDSQTITEEHVFSQPSWPARESGENSILTTMTPSLQSSGNSLTEQQLESNAIPLLPMLSSSSPYALAPNNVDDIYHAQSYLNTERQAAPLLSDTMVQTETNEPPFSHIHTQTTSSNLDFDYSNVLAHMETQTSDDFLFSQLEFSDIETQTPWDDISSLNDSFETVDQLSIEIQTDLSSLPEQTPQQDSYGYFVNDHHGSLSEIPNKQMTTVTDTETQTTYEFPATEVISSYAQTLDFQLSNGIFYS